MAVNLLPSPGGEVNLDTTVDEHMFDEVIVETC